MLGVKVCGNADDDPSVLIGPIALCSMAVALKRKIVIVIIPCYWRIVHICYVRDLNARKMIKSFLCMSYALGEEFIIKLGNNILKL